MVTATYAVEVDWDNDGTFGHADADIVSDVLQMEWQMGRDFASMLTGRSRGGRCMITLDNDSNDGKYNSFNSSSAIFGLILPGRKIRIKATDTTGTVTLWQGFLDRINPQVSVSAINTALLEAVGPLGWLARADFELFLPLQTDQTTGATIDDLLDAVGWPAGDRDVDTGQSVIRQYYFNNSGVFGTRARKVSVVNAMHKVEETEQGFLHESKDGDIIFEDRVRRLAAPHLTAQVTLSDNPSAGELSYGRITQGDPLKQIFNIFTTVIQNFTVGAQQVIWTQPEAVASGPDIPTIAPNETKSYVATIPVDAEYDLVSTWTTLTATTDYVGNSQSDGLGTNLTASLGVSETKLGQALLIDITNNHSSSTIYLTKLQARGQPLNFDDPVLVLEKDNGSITAYGQRQYPVPAELVRDSEEGSSHVKSLLRVYKDPRPQLDVLLYANKSADHLGHVLRRAVSDKLNIEAQSSNTDLGINTGFFIESMHHRVNSKFEHIVTWACSSLNAVSPWFVVGHNELGTTSALYY